MNRLFNTTFEISLRALLVLDALGGKSKSADDIAALDFIASYGADFGIGSTNLHGTNNFKYSELAVRRELTKQALRNLALKGLVDARHGTGGFEYSSNAAASAYCAKLDDDYANEYRASAIGAIEYAASQTAHTLIGIIQSKSIATLRGRTANG